MVISREKYEELEKKLMHFDSVHHTSTLDSPENEIWGSTQVTVSNNLSFVIAIINTTLTQIPSYFMFSFLDFYSNFLVVVFNYITFLPKSWTFSFQSGEAPNSWCHVRVHTKQWLPTRQFHIQTSLKPTLLLLNYCYECKNDVPLAMLSKTQFFWDIVLCCSVNNSKHFEGAYCLQHQSF